MLSQVRIVLVSPSGPANIGGVCRAMANMGLSDLAIVTPRCDPQHPDAVAYASHAGAVLEGARIVADIPAALAGCVRSYATTSRLGLYRRQAAMTPGDAAAELLPLTARGPVALVFGREDYGLRVPELLHFDRVVTIPADDGYPVMNLAASVAVCCYELRQTWLAQADESPLPMAISGPLAPDERKQALYRKLFDALERIHFFHERNPDHLKHALRQFFGRTEMTINEVDILIGMACQIRWHADHHRTLTPPPTAAD